MTQKRKVTLLRIWGYAFCVIPPVLAVLEHFPLWVKEGRTTAFSAMSILLLLLCCIPFRRGIRQCLRSPSPWQMWLILLVLLYFAKNITDGLLAVAAVGFPSSLAGSLFFWRAKKLSCEVVS